MHNVFAWMLHVGIGYRLSLGEFVNGVVFPPLQLGQGFQGGSLEPLCRAKPTSIQCNAGRVSCISFR